MVEIHIPLREVSDDGLAAAFLKWSLFVKAQVVRDKVTTKSKGYGFVSYTDPEDFMKAWEICRF
ncbi:hypothetical protein PSHT_05420 [Puccinia striiformis]|uniref:RRM domain-containing protein n=3 Tax=Puccinia striiformis TaxID=27350 RepID=A0A0L0UYZ8_9BASI|nr:hypothetical protein PSTG_14367 [Puccinia striiformis f. sp. tritici PST-78]POW08814.1 hypothetical protein PSTT_07255 [Puccinia striiformis]POW18771.1 hypothetical protein PSHT_05420 [Puccinia striiformis]